MGRGQPGGYGHAGGRAAWRRRGSNRPSVRRSGRPGAGCRASGGGIAAGSIVRDQRSEGLQVRRTRQAQDSPDATEQRDQHVPAMADGRDRECTTVGDRVPRCERGAIGAWPDGTDCRGARLVSRAGRRSRGGDVSSVRGAARWRGGDTAGAVFDAGFGPGGGESGRSFFPGGGSGTQVMLLTPTISLVTER